MQINKTKKIYKNNKDNQQNQNLVPEKDQPNYNPLARVIKGEQEKAQMSKIINERKDITTNLTKIRTIIKYYKNIC